MMRDGLLNGRNQVERCLDQSLLSSVFFAVALITVADVPRRKHNPLKSNCEARGLPGKAGTCSDFRCAARWQINGTQDGRSPH